jgi:hypothetical protein
MTLPQLHLADWRPTKDTQHLHAQIIGKIRLATTTPRNHWWNVPLYVDVRDLSTRRLHHRGTTFEMTFDFADRALIVRTADGRTRSFGLGSGVPVADFDARIHAIIGELGVDVDIKEEPFGVPMTTPFTGIRRTRHGTARPSRSSRSDSGAATTRSATPPTTPLRIPAKGTSRR